MAAARSRRPNFWFGSSDPVSRWNHRGDSVPVLLFDGGSDVRSCRLRFSERAKNFFASQVWLIGLAFVIGLFLGHPMLFLDTSSVTKAITNETLKYASLQQFSRGQLMNLSVVWRYVTYLIPFAMYPVLWLVPYCAILYLLFRRGLYSLSVPILIFSFLYLYFMGKGYLGPYFARITILLFPGFCVLVGIACNDLQLKVRNKRTAAVVLSGALLLIFVPSLVFDLAYDRAMQQKDAREVLRQDLRNSIGEVPMRVGILHYGPYFYTAMPAAKPLTSDKVVVQLQDAGEDADYLLVGLPPKLIRRKSTQSFGRSKRRENLDMPKAIECRYGFLDTSLSSCAFLKT